MAADHDKREDMAVSDKKRGHRAKAETLRRKKARALKYQPAAAVK